MHKYRNHLPIFLICIFCINSGSAHINLLGPKGGETFVPGEIITISWEEEQTHVPVDFDLQFSSDGGATWEIVEDSKDNPALFEILSNYPNPFQSGTLIEFNLSQYDHVSLEVYNIQGAKVATLLDEALSAGKYITPWNATGNRPGMYLAQVRVGTFIETRKLIKLE